MLRDEFYAAVDCDLVQYYDSEGPWRDLFPARSFPTWNAFNFTVGIYDQMLGRTPLERGHWSLSLGDLQEI